MRCAIVRCSALSPNDIYRLRTDVGTYVAKVFRRTWRSRQDVHWEATLQREVNRHGGPTPAVIPTRRGEVIAPVPSPEGLRWCLLQKDVPGEKPAKPFTADLYCRFGETAARLHTAFDQTGVAARRPARTLDALLAVPLAVIEPLFAGLPPEDWRFVTDLTATVHAHLATIAPALDWGICHGDLSLDNVVRAPTGSLTLHDYDLAAPSFRAADFFGIQQSQPDEHWQAFVAGYRLQRAISDRDIDAVPWFVPAWTIWSMAHDATHRIHWHGNWIVGPDQLSNRLVLLRSWAEWHL